MNKLIRVIINNFSVKINRTVASAYNLKDGDVVDKKLQEKLVMSNSAHIAAVKHLTKKTDENRN